MQNKPSLCSLFIPGNKGVGVELEVRPEITSFHPLLKGPPSWRASFDHLQPAPLLEFLGLRSFQPEAWSGYLRCWGRGGKRRTLVCGLVHDGPSS